MYRTAAITKHVFLPFVMDILQENTKIYSFIHIGSIVFFRKNDDVFQAYFLETKLNYIKKTPYCKHIPVCHILY
jgi:hypothetical protein